MLLACIKTEQKKLRHSHLWAAFLVIPLLPTVMGLSLIHIFFWTLDTPLEESRLDKS